MPIQHTRSLIQAFTLRKQADMFTSVSDTFITNMRSLRGYGPLRETDLAISDRKWYGKGHSHATFRDRVQKSYIWPSQERSGSSLDCLFAASYVMGNLVSTGANPYTHTLTWQDLATNKEVRYTTVTEANGSEYKKRLEGAWISQFTVTANRNDHVVLSFEGGGRNYVDSTLSMPAGPTAAVFYKTLFGHVNFGTAGTLSSIDPEVLSWNLTFNQNPDPFYLMGNTAGTESQLSKVLIGDQTVSGQVVIFINATHRARFLSQETVGLQLNALGSRETSDLIGGATQHQMSISIPNFKLSEETFGEEGQTGTYTLHFNEDSVLKVAGQDHASITFTSDIPASDILVTG